MHVLDTSYNTIYKTFGKLFCIFYTVKKKLEMFILCHDHVT